MQVAFYLAGEITQVKESIPWVRCASGNVFFKWPIESNPNWNGVTWPWAKVIRYYFQLSHFSWTCWYRPRQQWLFHIQLPSHAPHVMFIVEFWRLSKPYQSCLLLLLLLLWMNSEHLFLMGTRLEAAMKECLKMFNLCTWNGSKLRCSTSQYKWIQKIQILSLEFI